MSATNCRMCSLGYVWHLASRHLAGLLGSASVAARRTGLVASAYELARDSDLFMARLRMFRRPIRFGVWAPSPLAITINGYGGPLRDNPADDNLGCSRWVRSSGEALGAMSVTGGCGNPSETGCFDICPLFRRIPLVVIQKEVIIESMNPDFASRIRIWPQVRSSQFYLIRLTC